MPSERIRCSDDVINFLRREAPTELQRLESIARLVGSKPGHLQSRPQPRDSSYEAWLQATFGIFGTRKDIEGAA
jgi:hypothetical protein